MIEVNIPTEVKSKRMIALAEYREKLTNGEIEK